MLLLFKSRLARPSLEIHISIKFIAILLKICFAFTDNTRTLPVKKQLTSYVSLLVQGVHKQIQ